MADAILDATVATDSVGGIIKGVQVLASGVAPAVAPVNIAGATSYGFVTSNPWNSLTLGPVGYAANLVQLAASGATTVLPINGALWASAQIIFNAASSGTTFAVEYATDNAYQLNWFTSGLGAPEIVRIDTASSNPSVVPANGSTFVPFSFASGVCSFMFPLPANACAVRIRQTNSGAASFVGIAPGLPYVAGCPVVATLYQGVSGTNSAVDTGTFDLSGWTSASAICIPTLATGVTYSAIDDTGASRSLYVQTAPATTGLTVALARAPGGVAQFAGNPTIGGMIMTKRMRFQAAAVAASATYLSIEAAR